MKQCNPTMAIILTLISLGVIIFFSFLILPIFLTLGYTIRVMKNITEGNDTLPEFDNIGSMFIDGVKYFIVEIVYALIPLIIMGIGLIPIFIAAPAALLDPGAIIAALGVSLIFVILGFIAAIITSAIAYMAVVNMAHTGEFGAAFRISEIIQRIKNIGIGAYILWFVSFFIINMILSILYGIIMIIPLLGIILVLLVGYSYLFLFMSKSMASIYMEGS